jgi:hypothetical protein
MCVCVGAPNVYIYMLSIQWAPVWPRATPSREYSRARRFCWHCKIIMATRRAPARNQLDVDALWPSGVETLRTFVVFVYWSELSWRIYFFSSTHSYRRDLECAIALIFNLPSKMWVIMLVNFGDIVFLLWLVCAWLICQTCLGSISECKY